MSDLPVITAGELTLLCGPADELLIAITAKLALAGPVHVLDAGNRFDAYNVARLVLSRRDAQRDRLPQILGHIRVARAFTCYQVAALFEQPAGAVPCIVFDLLATFRDENVPLDESYRLLRIVVGHLQRLRGMAPVVVGAHLPGEARAGLLRLLADAADRVFVWETPPAVPPAALL
jgi:hypothetical protein